MNGDQLKRLMHLVRRTGDTLVVTDPDGKEPIVLMDAARYEALVDVFVKEDAYAEEELYTENPIVPDDRVPEMVEEPPHDLPVEDVEPPFAQKEPEIEDVVPKELRKKPKNDSDDDISEEQFYLEPID